MKRPNRKDYINKSTKIQLIADQELYIDFLETKIEQLRIGGVVSSKRKNTLELFMQLMEEFKEACSEEDNGIYDPLEEFGNYILEKYEIIEK